TGREDDYPEPVIENPGYVGLEACANCHAERVAQFRQTKHLRANRVPREGDMPAAFSDGRGKHPSHLPAVRFEMSRVGDDFFQTSFQQTAKGEQRSTARIAFAYGAGPADEIYFSWTDDRLYELPVAWLHPLDCWGNAPFTRHGKGDFSREMMPRCLECHNTWF